MEIVTAIKILRKELCLTQKELADALKVSYVTVNRWETGKNIPDTMAINRLAAFAQTKGASDICQKYLQETLRESHKKAIKVPDSDLYSVERESICQLVDDSSNAVYVADMETDELLYVNHKAEEYFGKKFKTGKGQKCYEFVANRSTACEGCPKKHMSEHEFSDTHVHFPSQNKYYHVRGKKIRWNERPAHAQYLADETGAIEAQGGIKNMLDTVRVGICVGYIHDDGRAETSYLNDGYYAMIGEDRENRRKYMGFSVLDGFVPEDREPVQKRLYEACSRRQDFDVTYRITCSNGQIKWLRACGQFVGREGNKSKYFCIVTDIDRFRQ